MKKILFLLSMLISLSGMAQTTPWSTSPAVTPQTRTLSGSPQIRWLFGSNLYSIEDSLAKKLAIKDSTTKYITPYYFNHNTGVSTQFQINAIISTGKLNSDTLFAHGYVPQWQLRNSLSGKQATLLSGTNLKTVNLITLLGSGNLAITPLNTDTTATGFATQESLIPYITKAQSISTNVPYIGSTLTPYSILTTGAGGNLTTQAEIVHQSVDYATTAALPANTYSNGTSGVGATLTATANGALTVDQIAVLIGDRILVYQESAQSHNGIYVVTATGDVTHPYILTRGSYSSVAANIAGGMQVYVKSGTQYAGNLGITYQQITPGNISIGTTALVFQPMAFNYIANSTPMARDALQVSGKLRSYQAKASQIYNSTAVTVNALGIGDSAAYPTTTLLPSFLTSFGFGGQHGGGAQSGVNGGGGGGASSVGVPTLITTLTSSGTTATVTLANHGLITGTVVSISGAFYAPYNGTFTITGATTNTFTYTMLSSTTSPDIATNSYFSVGADYTKWITGAWTNLPVGGYITYARASYAYNAAAAFTIAKVFYIKEVGGGTFKVQQSTDGATWTDISGYTSISCSDTQNNLGILTIPVTGPIQIKVIGVTGSCKMVSTGFEGTIGAKVSYLLAAGGSMMKNYALCPERIWKTYLADFQPDVITIGFKDDVDSGMIAALSTIQQYIYDAAPNCAVIWEGTYNGQRDDPGFTPAPAYSTTAAAQNAAIKSFVNTTTIPGEKYYWDSGYPIGKWAEAAAMGLFDASAITIISTATVSGTTATITTAAPHGLTGTVMLRVSGVSDPAYNGLFLTATVTGTSTITYTLTGTPLGSGTGGNCASTSDVHLSQAGSNTMQAALMRDFSVLTGPNNYPTGITAAGLQLSGLFPTTGGTISGDVNITSTTEAFSTSTEAVGVASLRSAGGIYAAKTLRSDLGLILGATNSLGNSKANILQAFSNTSGSGANITTNVAFTAASGNPAVGGLFSTLNLSLSGSAGTTFGNEAAVYGVTNVSGSGGTLGGGAGGYFQASNSATTASITGVYSKLTTSGGATTNAFGVYADASLSTAPTNAYAFLVSAGYNSANYYSYYNASIAKNFMGSGFTGLGGAITSPTAFADIAAAVAGNASLRIREAGLDPTSPNAGDIWVNGGLLKYRDGTNSATRTVVNLAQAQTLTNKTLTSPQINTPSINTTSIVGQVLTATNTTGTGDWTTLSIPDSTINVVKAGTGTQLITQSKFFSNLNNYFKGITLQADGGGITNYKSYTQSSSQALNSTFSVINTASNGDGPIFWAGNSTRPTLSLSNYAGTAAATFYGDGHAVIVGNITSPAFVTSGGDNTKVVLGDGTLGMYSIGSLVYNHTIFTPTTGSTVSLVNKQYNIINPAGALVTLTVNLPSSPANNDTVYIKFTQTVSTVTYGNGTVVDGITAPTAGGLTVLTYDSGTTSWY